MEGLQYIIEQLRAKGVSCGQDVAMAPYTTFHIGGEAALLVEPTTNEQLCCALRTVRLHGARAVVLGRASNVLLSDEHMDVVFIRTAQLKDVSIEGEELVASCGATLAEIARHAQAAALAGMEFAYGIPGTLGGALCMNAGAYGYDMSGVVSCAQVYDAEQDQILELNREQLQLSYRHSVLLSSPLLFVLSSHLRLPYKRRALPSGKIQNSTK